jgi:hypothetical protein
MVIGSLMVFRSAQGTMQADQDRQRQQLNPEMLLHDRPADPCGTREYVIRQPSMLVLRLPQLRALLIPVRQHGMLRCCHRHRFPAGYAAVLRLRLF